MNSELFVGLSGLLFLSHCVVTMNWS